MLSQRSFSGLSRIAAPYFYRKTPIFKFACLNSSRNASTSSGGQASFAQRYKYVIAGAAGLSLGTLAYLFKSEKTSSGDVKLSTSAEEEFVGTKFVEDRLEEKLAILEKNGPIPYLLIGAGTASFSAFRAIRSRDPTSRIVVLGEEPFYPYMRPPLSKELWQGGEAPPMGSRLVFKQWNGRERSLFFEQDDFYTPVEDLFENKNGGVSIVRGVKVVRIDPTEKIVYLENGKMLRYNKCLLATGARPKNLTVFEDSDENVRKRVMLYRGVDDYHRLNKILQKARSIAVVGGGFLGSELACALGQRASDGSLSVTQLYPESGNLAKILPEYLSGWTMQKVKNQHVHVVPKVNVKNVSYEDKSVKLQLDNDQTVSVDHVIVAVGVDARTELAEKSGLETDEKHGGFLVNTELEARKDLWVAGDASCFYDTKLGRRRVEHHDHAIVSGRLAGENMTGSGKPYWHQSMFWSDLGPEIALEGIGLVDSSLETVGVFSKTTPDDSEKKSATESTDASSKDIEFEDRVPRLPRSNDEYNKGIVFYLKKDTVVGILLWNVFSKMNVARKIINESKPYDDLSEVAKLFDLKSTESEESSE